MLFNSLQFLLFFIIITLTYFTIQHKYRWLLLLIASCFFYMAFIPAYILILAGVIIIDFLTGIFLEKYQGRGRKLLLIVSITANIGVLAVFKYYNFLNEAIASAIGNLNVQSPMPVLKMLLPLGLSFHTFQAMSYTIEVYRGNQKAEKHFGIYALYVMFYPQLVAGPIERPQNLLPQFYEPHKFDFERFKSGFTLMAFGLFKKVVIADRLAMSVDYAYSNINTQTGLSLFVAAFFYAIQIYCDFSGYSDIAIGAARIMGFNLMENFRAPYFSKSIAEFWRRWHISLSTWFRDYLYIPLGGNKSHLSRWHFNIFIVFLLSGLWHGANWTFIIWGILHGLMVMLASTRDKLLAKKGISFNSKWLRLPNILITFTLVTLALIIFRAPSVSNALTIFQKIATISIYDNVSLFYYRNELLFCFLLIMLLMVKDRFFFNIPVKNNSSFYIINILILISCYFFGMFNYKQFIYFQF